MEEELGYWERFEETVKSSLLVRSKGDKEFKDRMMSLVQAHIEKLKYTWKGDYFLLSDKNDKWFLFCLYKKIDPEDVALFKCKYCALQDICEKEGEPCIKEKFNIPGSKVKFFVLYSDWSDFIYNLSVGFCV